MYGILKLSKIYYFLESGYFWHNIKEMFFTEGLL